jgi:phosphatidylserine/phosphatidylglycerophosphate/cardiolipin synthase-like enzyme
VTVRSAPSYFALTHQKTIVVDDKVADIMTLNLTSEYYSTSRDFAVVDRQPKDVAAIEAAFNADWTANRITPAGSGDLVWSPGALDSQLNLINEAHSSLDVYNEEMADSQITGALAAAARRGVDVKVVMTADSEWDSALAELAAAGVHVRTYSEDASLYIHAKMILVDGTKAFLGSQNFSAGSLNHNRELGITLSDRSILTSLERTFASDYEGAESFAQPAAAQPTPVVATLSPTSAGCSVHASYDARYRDWNVDVSGAPADTPVTATAGGITDSYHTGSSGSADIYLKAPAIDAGDPVSIRAASASCTGTL